MTVERLKELQSEMSNETLIKEVERQITELARTGGKSHRMCVPPMPEDTDMILSELIKRFKCALANERITMGLNCRFNAVLACVIYWVARAMKNKI